MTCEKPEEKPSLESITSERIDEPTPNGGAYSIAYFRDSDGNPAEKENAFSIEIQEFTADGECIFRTYGYTGRYSAENGGDDDGQ